MIRFWRNSPGNEAERDGQLASMLKMEGLVNDDPEVVSWMDRHPDQAPQVIPVSLKKDGSFTKNSSVASAEQLEQLGYMVNRRVQALAGWMDVRRNSGESLCDDEGQ